MSKHDLSQLLSSNNSSRFKTKEQFVNYLKKILPELNEAQSEIVGKFIEEEAVKAARLNYYTYVRLMGPVLMGDFVDGRHIEMICDKLQEVAEHALKKGQRRKKLKVNMPPGSSKTQLCSRMFGSWVLGRWPWAKLLICTHGLVFGRDEIGMKMLDILKTPEYKRIFPDTELREDKQTSGRFLTTEEGEMYVTSLSAGTSGRRGHIILSDDAVVESDAYSKDIKDKRNQEYTTNIRTRFQPGYNGGEILIGTAWTLGDIFDYVEEADKTSSNKWDIIKFPALLTEHASQMLRRKDDPEGWYEPDTSYWPEMYTTEQLRDVRASMSSNLARWNSLYMQAPSPEEGAIFQPKDFRQWIAPNAPPIHTKFTIMDTAYTKNTQSDPTAYITLGIFNYRENGVLRPNIILLDWKYDKYDFPELMKVIEELHRKKKPEFFLIEEQSSGLAVIPEMRNRGIPVVAWKTDKDKIARCHASAPLLRSGIFWVPMPEGDDRVCQKSMEFISVMCAMNQKDTVDCLTSAMIYMRDTNLLIGENYDVTEEEFYDDDDLPDDAYGGSYTSALL